MSEIHTPPPPDAPIAASPPERRCPRCGSALSPDQEWCLSCGAAADTEVVEARGWRVPIYLSGGLAALTMIGIILVIVALSGGKEQVQQQAQTPVPTASSVPPAPTPTVTPAPPTATPTVSPDPNATPTVSPDPNATPTVSPDPAATATPDNTGTSTGSTWSGTDGWTIIIESATSQAKADKVAQSATSKGVSSVGTLNSSDYSSLNAGYFVVFSGQYTSKKDAEANLSAVQASYKDAYVRRVKK